MEEVGAEAYGVAARSAPRLKAGKITVEVGAEATFPPPLLRTLL